MYDMDKKSFITFNIGFVGIILIALLIPVLAFSFPNPQGEHNSFHQPTKCKTPGEDELASLKSIEEFSSITDCERQPIEKYCTCIFIFTEKDSPEKDLKIKKAFEDLASISLGRKSSLASNYVSSLDAFANARAKLGYENPSCFTDDQAKELRSLLTDRKQKYIEGNNSEGVSAQFNPSHAASALKSHETFSKGPNSSPSKPLSDADIEYLTDMIIFTKVNNKNTYPKNGKTDKIPKTENQKFQNLIAEERRIGRMFFRGLRDDEKYGDSPLYNVSNFIGEGQFNKGHSHLIYMARKLNKGFKFNKYKNNLSELKIELRKHIKEKVKDPNKRLKEDYDSIFRISCEAARDEITKSVDFKNSGSTIEQEAEKLKIEMHALFGEFSDPPEIEKQRHFLLKLSDLKREYEHFLTHNVSNFTGKESADKANLLKKQKIFSLGELFCKESGKFKNVSQDLKALPAEKREELAKEITSLHELKQKAIDLRAERRNNDIGLGNLEQSPTDTLLPNPLNALTRNSSPTNTDPLPFERIMTDRNKAIEVELVELDQRIAAQEKKAASLFTSQLKDDQKVEAVRVMEATMGPEREKIPTVEIAKQTRGVIPPDIELLGLEELSEFYRKEFGMADVPDIPKELVVRNDYVDAETSIRRMMEQKGIDVKNKTIAFDKKTGKYVVQSDEEIVANVIESRGISLKNRDEYVETNSEKFSDKEILSYVTNREKIVNSTIAESSLYIDKNLDFSDKFLKSKTSMPKKFSDQYKVAKGVSDFSDIAYKSDFNTAKTLEKISAVGSVNEKQLKTKKPFNVEKLKKKIAQNNVEEKSNDKTDGRMNVAAANIQPAKMFKKGTKIAPVKIDNTYKQKYEAQSGILDKVLSVTEGITAKYDSFFANDEEKKKAVKKAPKVQKAATVQNQLEQAEISALTQEVEDLKRTVNNQPSAIPVAEKTEEVEKDAIESPAQIITRPGERFNTTFVNAKNTDEVEVAEEVVGRGTTSSVVTSATRAPASIVTNKSNADGGYDYSVLNNYIASENNIVLNQEAYSFDEIKPAGLKEFSGKTIQLPEGFSSFDEARKQVYLDELFKDGETEELLVKSGENGKVFKISKNEVELEGPVLPEAINAARNNPGQSIYHNGLKDLLKSNGL